MAFHCNVCGSDLSGDYESCPVCEKVRSILGSYKPKEDAPKEEVVLPVAPAEEAPELPAAEEISAPEAEEAPIEEPAADDFEELSLFGSLPEEEPEAELPEESEEPEEPEEEAEAVGLVPAAAAEIAPAAPEASEAMASYEPAPVYDSEGILERHLKEKAAADPTLKKRGNALFGIVVVLLTIILGVCTAVYVAVPLIERRAEEAAAASYMEYIEGSWLSEYFAFKDRPSECCVEMLTVSADGTFVMDYLLPDTENAEGWADGSWESTYKVIGTVKIDAASQRLMLLYDEGGVSYFYDRYFVSMDEGEMYLREYYDAAHTSYYDVCFNKVA